MKNKEKYAKEIAELACNESDIAVSKATGNPIDCNIIKCDRCALYKGGTYNCATCHGALRKWAESEYNEKPVINKRDSAFLEYLREERKYIARDEDGKLCVYSSKPVKEEKYWYLCNGHCSWLDFAFDVDFPMVKWEDSEPWLIEDLRKLEVVDSYE